VFTLEIRDVRDKSPSTLHLLRVWRTSVRVIVALVLTGVEYFRHFSRFLNYSDELSELVTLL